MSVIDLSFLDQPWILRLIFYPRKEFEIEPRDPKTVNHFIEVGEGVSIGCRFYPANKRGPTVFYFHGNGETVCDYDYVAPLFQKIGINLFVNDYRGYGLSDGSPTVTDMVKDAHTLFLGFKRFIIEEGYEGDIFVMGRSLGSIPAIEVASSYSGELSGIIIESGFAGVLKLISRFNINIGSLDGDEGIDEKIEKIKIPALVIHAEKDQLIPLFIGKGLYNAIPSEEKTLVVIPDADHNNLMMVGMEEYFKALSVLVFGSESE
ncbi:MAG: alpha/beta hydrolase [Halobacteriota archaeon]|nr:alpha/beta hydrolase [Halobacteriota archaeon]